jgi:thiamine-monophosphate kinase
MDRTRAGPELTGQTEGRRRLPGEFELIARYFRPLAAGREGALGLQDDAALIDLAAGESLVVTADALVSGIHFLDDDPPDLIARKMLRVNLSDLAAMGARPLAYVMTCCLPPTVDEAWIAAFTAGLAADQREFDIALVGGDTTATPGPLTLSVTALGRVQRGRELRRSTARAGDLVAVSGTIGDGALGLALLQGRLAPVAGAEHLADRYHLPRPRLALGQRLCGLATSGMDVSDGLVGDLAHICEASGLGAVIEAAKVPLSAPAAAVLAREPQWLSTILTGGDDYELLFTLAPEREPAVEGLPVTVIGRMEPGRTVRVLDSSGRPLDMGDGGYRHF